MILVTVSCQCGCQKMEDGNQWEGGDGGGQCEVVVVVVMVVAVSGCTKEMKTVISYCSSILVEQLNITTMPMMLFLK